LKTRNRRSSRGRQALALISVLALVLAACGGDDDTTADDGADPAAGADADADAGDAGDADAPDDGEAVEFFEGETVTLVVPFSPGGGYDSYARMIAPYLEEELGADVVVENRDGAGGLLAINELTADTSDGLRIAIMNAVGVAGATVAGAEGAAFGLDDLAYVGRIGSESHMWAAGAGSQYEDVQDVLDAGSFRFGSTGPGAADYVLSSLLIEIFDLEGSEIITGFEGSSENELAATRGDTDGMTGDYDSRIGAVEDGDHRPLLIVGPERMDPTPDTPTIYELELDEEQEALVDATVAMIEMGRPLVTTPNISEDNLEYLRSAVERMMQRDDLVEESETQGRPLNYLSGQEMDALVQDILDAPDSFRETLEQAY
jgi:tripartite-type tricarboxylate transporter receptor subunit TctC